MADELKPGGGGRGVIRSGGLGGVGEPPVFVKGPTPDAPVASGLTASVGARASLQEILAGVRAGNVPQERAQFRMLLLSNPNYFGNLEGSELSPVVTIKGNTTYEELQCVGFEPQLELLEGVVLIKQDSGYLGSICTTGSVEYVRFYLSTDGGATWADQGQASFAVHDIPGDKPLEYAVSLTVDPAKSWCFFENLIKVRAILSWNDPPPANTPNYPPVWGNVVDADIQVDPFTLFFLGDILKEAKLQLPDNLADLVDLEMEIPGPPPKKLDALELHTLYAKADVPPHRYLLETVQEQLASTGILEAPPTAQAAGPPGPPSAKPTGKSLFQLVDIDIGKLLGAVFDTFGNTTYEALDCVGLNRVTDTLEAALTVKLSSGYSGDLCTAGSNEYVAFWIDWGAGWEYAGTSSVNVHDIQAIPPDGLHYAVALPVSLAGHRQPCDSGAQVVKVRAILSWQTTPSTLDPDFEPTWGNRVDTLVEIAPGPDAPPGTHLPNIETVGHVDVIYINPGTGLATGPSTGGFSVLDSPFGGAILLTGHIAYPPDSYLGGAAPLQYRVWAYSGGSWQKLMYPFGVTVHRLHNGTWLPGLATTQTADPDGWYDYLEDTDGPFRRTVAENVLHIWYTNPSMNDLGYLLIEARDSANPMGPHWWSNFVTVQLDNLPPESDLVITSGGGACADFEIGDLIEGTYEVSDQGNHFGSFHLYVEPSPQANTGQLTVDPAPAGPPIVVGPVAPPNISRSYTGLPGGVPTTGESGTWSLDTSQMPRCGYVLRMDAWDRTNVNSSGPGWWATPITVGLCLREKE